MSPITYPINSIFSDKFLAALDLMELSIELKRHSIVRNSSDLSEDQVSQELQSWLNNQKSIRQN